MVEDVGGTDKEKEEYDAGIQDNDDVDMDMDADQELNGPDFHVTIFPLYAHIHQLSSPLKQLPNVPHLTSPVSTPIRSVGTVVIVNLNIVNDGFVPLPYPKCHRSNDV